MWYIFDKNKQCIATADFKPNISDLNSRNEIAIDSNEIYQINTIYIDDNNNILVKHTQQPTKDQLLAQLDAQYQPQFKSLQQAWAAAQLDGNTSLAAELQAEYQSLKVEYQTKLEAILNG